MMMMPTRGDDWQKKRRLGDESFNQMLAEVKAVAKDRDEELRLLTERVLLGLVQRQSMKPQQWIISPCQIPKRKRSSLHQKAPIKKMKLTSPEPEPEPTPKTNFNSIEEKAASESASAFGEIRKFEACKLKKEKKVKPMKEKKQAMRRSALPIPSQEKKQAMRRSALPIPSQAPEMPEELKEKIASLHGYRVQFVMHKILFSADLKKDQARMTMPQNQVFNKEFLGEFYREKLKNERQMRVKVIDPSLNVHELRLTKWNFTNSFSYALTSGWYDNIVVDKTNNLMEKDVLQVWSFQIDNPDSLCFALVKVPKDETTKKHVDVYQHDVELAVSKKDVDGKQESAESWLTMMSNAGQDSVESSMKKNKSGFGGLQHVNLRFGGKTIARFDVPVCVV